MSYHTGIMSMFGFGEPKQKNYGTEADPFRTNPMTDNRYAEGQMKAWEPDENQFMQQSPSMMAGGGLLGGGKGEASRLSNVTDMPTEQYERYIMDRSTSPEGFDPETMNPQEKARFTKWLMEKEKDPKKTKDMAFIPKIKDMSTPNPIGLGGLIGMATKQY